VYNVTCWALVYASPIQMDPRWESNISEERRDRVRSYREETIMSQRSLAKKLGAPDDREKKRNSFIGNFKLPRDAPIVMFPSILLFSVAHIYIFMVRVKRKRRHSYNSIHVQNGLPLLLFAWLRSTSADYSDRVLMVAINCVAVSSTWSPHSLFATYFLFFLNRVLYRL
jgi:hypothetical protein